MQEKKVTCKDLSEELDLSIGTVRNWFYGNKDMPRKHKDKISEIMDEVFDEEHDPLGVAFLAVGKAADANTTLWNSAAGLPEYNFTKAFAFARYTRNCARWCTKVIMEETQRILKELPKEETKTIAYQLMQQDQKAEIENDGKFCLYRGTHILRVRGGAVAGGTKLFIPVAVKGYKHLFVRIAAEAARKKNPEQELSFGKFIVSCLNAAATKAFNRDLERFFSQEE